MNVETSLEIRAARQGRLQNTTFTLGIYMGKENTISKWIKLDFDEFKLKQAFLQRFQWPSTPP